MCITAFILSLLYQVFVNGKFYFDFKHRQPMQSVQSVQVEGDVNVLEPMPLL